MTITAQIIADSESQRTCSKCGHLRPVTAFQKFNGKPGGQCRVCKTTAMKASRLSKGIAVRKRSEVIEGEKLCLSCSTMRPLTDFSPSKRGLGGVSSYCRACANARPTDRETIRRNTAEYRVRHPERWRALHRLSQFKRRTLLAAAADGTITDEVLREIYARTHCCYCRQPISEKKRTLEHIIPLSRGGQHSVTNIAMACFSCNSSKSYKTPEEFVSL